MAQFANDSFPPLPEEVAFPVSPQSVAADDSQPPLPSSDGPFPFRPPFPPISIPQLTTFKLKKGTYLFNYSKTPSFGGILNFGLMDGTFRFESTTGLLGPIRASGDMYRRPVRFVPGHKVGQIWIGPMWIPGAAPLKDQGIPILGLDDYEGYLRVVSMSVFLTNDNSFDLEFQKYKWDATTKAFAVDAAGTTVVEETFVARMAWTAAPVGWPSAGDYLTGEVKVKSSDVIAGSIQMGWVSDKYRKIGLEIDAVRGCYFPLFNAARRSIWQLLEDAGFQIAKKSADENSITDTANSIWTDAELHAAMLAHRQTVDLNKEWTYHALMVPRFDQEGVLGIMYDDVVYGSDTNNVAREGFAVAAQLQTGPPANWGTEANEKLQDAQDSFVRTTIHELSHAMGMQHPDAYTPAEVMDQTYTCQTWSLIQNAQQTGVIYPSNIQWRHSPLVQTRLRHYPDVRVRPGGIQFNKLGGVNGVAPFIPPNDVVPQLPGLRVHVKPVLGEIPIGAPVRIEVTLRNESEYSIQVPREIGLKGDALRGDVQDSNGIRRPFKPIRACHDTEDPLTTLDAGKSMTTSMTILAGREGPLFPSTGVHTITTILSWKQYDSHGSPVNFWLDAKTTVMVTGARSASHAAAAHRVLAEPQTLLSVILAGDHLEKGIKAIQQACEDETLGPHYACIEARRYANPFMGRKAEIERAKKLVGRKGTVMSQAEKKKMDRLFKDG